MRWTDYKNSALGSKTFNNLTFFCNDYWKEGCKENWFLPCLTQVDWARWNHYMLIQRLMFLWKQQQSKKSINIIFLSSKCKKLLDPIAQHESSQFFFFTHWKRPFNFNIQFACWKDSNFTKINSFCLFCFYLQVTWRLCNDIPLKSTWKWTQKYTFC